MFSPIPEKFPMIQEGSDYYLATFVFKMKFIETYKFYLVHFLGQQYSEFRTDTFSNFRELCATHTSVFGLLVLDVAASKV